MFKWKLFLKINSFMQATVTLTYIQMRIELALT